MNPSNHELDKEHAFDSYMKKSLKNDLRNFFNEMKRLHDKEATFSDLSAQTLRQLSAKDEYFVQTQTFDVQGKDIIINDERITEALQNLPKHKRDIIMLYYFLNLTDDDIGKKLDMVRSTVQYQRASTLLALKKMLKEELVDE